MNVITNGPISFTKSDGSQLSIMPYALQFVSGVLTVPPVYDDALPWLEHLVSIGVIKEAPPQATSGQAAPPPVLSMTSTWPGAWGNNITMNITYGSGGNDFHATVTAALVLDLDTSTMGKLLGKDAALPEMISPVYFVGSTLVAGSTPKNTSSPLNLTSSVLAINKIDDSGVAFELGARKAPPGGHPITVSISNAVAGSSQFRLTLGWTATSSNYGLGAVSGSTLTTLRNQFTSELGYLVDVVYNGGAPAAGDFYLTGGREGSKAHTFTPVSG